MPFDLHQHEKLPFSDEQDETITYVERVTLNEAQAIEEMANQLGIGVDDIDIEPVWMVWTEESSGGRNEFGLEFPCWVLCEEGTPSAVPFWREPSRTIGGGKSRR
jgi:hypothetical protein